MGFDKEESKDMGKLVTEWHTGRCEELLSNCGGKVICGG